MGIDATSLTAIVKELYPDSKVREELYSKNPLFGILAKDRNAHGELVKVALRYGDPVTVSATFTERAATEGITASKYAAFDLTTVNEYGFAEITGESIDKTKNDRGSFIRIVDREIAGVMRQMKNRMSISLFRSGSGSIGRRASISTNTITLTNPSDTRFFEIGMRVQASSTDSASGVRTGYTHVTAVNRLGGTVTVNSAAAITSFSDNDYLFPRGDIDGKIKGLEAWVPASDPTSTPFFGVDRSSDVTRLGGLRKDLSGKPIEEALLEASELCVREQGAPDLCVMHTTDFMNLQKALGSKVIYGARDSYDTKIGYRTIQMEGPAGTIDIVADPNAPLNVAWMLQSDTWCLYSMGETPKYLDNDGNLVLRTTTSDAVEIQLVSRLQLGCAAPGWNGRFIIGS